MCRASMKFITAGCFGRRLADENHDTNNVCRKQNKGIKRTYYKPQAKKQHEAQLADDVTE